MCRLVLLFALLCGLVVGQCAVADRLAQVHSTSCVTDGDEAPCCPAEPVPCQCDDADAAALVASVIALPVPVWSQELLAHLPTSPTWRPQEPIVGTARAPPGLAALRCVILLI